MATNRLVLGPVSFRLTVRSTLSNSDYRTKGTAPILTKRYYGWLTLGYLALVVYGSLVPLHFRFVSPREAIAQYQDAMSSSLDFKSRSDWAANFLLFIPLGFLLMGSLAVDRPTKVGW